MRYNKKKTTELLIGCKKCIPLEGYTQFACWETTSFSEICLCYSFEN